MRNVLWGFLLLIFVVNPVSGNTGDERVWFEGPQNIVAHLERSSEGKLFTTIMLKDGPHRFNIDTGAGTTLDISLAHSLGLVPTDTGEIGYGLTGQGAKRLRTRIDLRVGELKITGMPVDCIDLKDLNRVAVKGNTPTFDGIIGADLLAYLGAVIDFQHLTLTLTRPG